MIGTKGFRGTVTQLRSFQAMAWSDVYYTYFAQSFLITRGASTKEWGASRTKELVKQYDKSVERDEVYRIEEKRLRQEFENVKSRMYLEHSHDKAMRELQIQSENSLLNYLKVGSQFVSAFKNPIC